MAGPDGQPGGPNNSGISIDFQPNLAVAAAQVAAGIGQAMADMEMSQGEAERFMSKGASDAMQPLVEGPGGVSDSSQL